MNVGYVSHDFKLWFTIYEMYFYSVAGNKYWNICKCLNPLKITKEKVGLTLKVKEVKDLEPQNRNLYNMSTQ